MANEDRIHRVVLKDIGIRKIDDAKFKAWGRVEIIFFDENNSVSAEISLTPTGMYKSDTPIEDVRFGLFEAAASLLKAKSSLRGKDLQDAADDWDAVERR